MNGCRYRSADDSLCRCFQERFRNFITIEVPGGMLRASQSERWRYASYTLALRLVWYATAQRDCTKISIDSIRSARIFSKYSHSKLHLIRPGGEQTLTQILFLYLATFQDQRLSNSSSIGKESQCSCTPV